MLDRSVPVPAPRDPGRATTVDDSCPASGRVGRLKPVPPHVLTPIVGILGHYKPGLTELLLVEALERVGVAPQAPDLQASLTKAEVARLGKVSLRTVNRWIRRGDLTARKIGRLVRIPRSAAEALLSAPAAAEGRAAK